jgi:GNAT superfamily N-acetyltransferase
VTGSTGPVVIRRIRATEGLLLRDLRLRSLEDAPDAFGQTLPEAAATPALEWHRKAMQSCRGDVRSWLVAQQGSEAVGLVHGRHRSPATLLLFSMWVDPRVRRIGVGRQLVEALEGWGHGWGAQETVLWVLRANEAALGFYQRLGFEILASGRDAELGDSFGALTLRRAADTQA